MSSARPIARTGACHDPATSRRRVVLVLVAFLVAVLATGCSATSPPQTPPRVQPQTQAQPPPATLAPCAPVAAPHRSPPPPVVPLPPYTVRVVVGTSVEGRPIEAEYVGVGRDVVFVLGGIHGDEGASSRLARALARHARADAALVLNRRVVVLADANPDGRLAGRRGNANGVDLNRNFPAPNRRDGRRNGMAALSEPEAAAIEQLVRLQAPGRVLSIHQPLACVDHDGPAEGLARRVAAACDLPVRKLGTRPGSMGAWLGEGLGIPLVTLELPKHADALDEAELWRRYGPALVAFVQSSSSATGRAKSASRSDR